MKVNFNGFNENVTTFLADTSVTAVGNENGREYLVLDSDSGSAGIIL